MASSVVWVVECVAARGLFNGAAGAAVNFAACPRVVGGMQNIAACKK